MNRTTKQAVYIIAAVLGGWLISQGTPAHAQLGLPDLPGGLRDIANDSILDRRVRERAEKAAEEAGDAVDETVATTTGAVTETVGTVTGAARQFLRAEDPTGAAIEAGTVVLMLDDSDVDALRADGFTIVAARALPALGKSLVTIVTSSGADLAGTVRELRRRFPESAVDYNHLYHWDEAPATGTEQRVDDVAAVDADSALLRIGVIDSAVQSDHHGLAGATVVHGDFVKHEGGRPQTHGTAVASIVARSAGNRVAIYAASVFFEIPGYSPGASSESLVAALDWLAAQDVDVINMSLSGPVNVLLEAAIKAVQAQGHVVVAAVGNNGPASEPMYPAAYDDVIGVTAVDRERRVFRNANRGDYVDYAALGVGVKVADSSTGGYRIASGTSMATPRIAVVVARVLREGGVEREALMSWLIASAEDLGRKGFDPVYGHGLIAQPPLVVSGN
ncbi:MAG: S8 family serine peptidase [Woeseiaceae bacterium]|nr:S8 family serine peptidase [Woeseiaceae bacterium]